jgi:hypothetical protein
MTADVLLECGAFEVDLELLRSQNPGLITVSISAYGSGGPKKNWPSSDITMRHVRLRERCMSANPAGWGSMQMLRRK